MVGIANIFDFLTDSQRDATTRTGRENHNTGCTTRAAVVDHGQTPIQVTGHYRMVIARAVFGRAYTSKSHINSRRDSIMTDCGNYSASSYSRSYTGFKGNIVSSTTPRFLTGGIKKRRLVAAMILQLWRSTRTLEQLP